MYALKLSLLSREEGIAKSSKYCDLLRLPCNLLLMVNVKKKPKSEFEQLIQGICNNPNQSFLFIGQARIIRMRVTRFSLTANQLVHVADQELINVFGRRSTMAVFVDNLKQ